MDKRRQARVPIQGLTADISDGKGFFTGTVSDISMNGVSLNNVSANLDCQADILSVIVDGLSGRFKLLIKQKWQSETGSLKIIGGHIENRPGNWVEYLSQIQASGDQEQAGPPDQ